MPSLITGAWIQRRASCWCPRRTQIRWQHPDENLEEVKRGEDRGNQSAILNYMMSFTSTLYVSLVFFFPFYIEGSSHGWNSSMRSGFIIPKKWAKEIEKKKEEWIEDFRGGGNPAFWKGVDRMFGKKKREREGREFLGFLTNLFHEMFSSLYQLYFWEISKPLNRQQPVVASDTSSQTGSIGGRVGSQIALPIFSPFSAAYRDLKAKNPPGFRYSTTERHDPQFIHGSIIWSSHSAPFIQTSAPTRPKDNKLRWTQHTDVHLCCV